MALSAVGAAAGWSAVNPVTGDTLAVKSLLSEESLQLIIAETPRTYTGFPPLGLVLTILLGAGVADGSGLFAALMRAALSAVSKRALVPATMLMGMLTCHAVDAGYVVFVPLAGRDRLPPPGAIRSWASRSDSPACPSAWRAICCRVSTMCLILGITETGARLIEPGWTMNPVGNWWFTRRDCRRVHRAGLVRHRAHRRPATRGMAR